MLTSSDTSEVRVPASVTIPAGQTSATFPITIVNDMELDGPQTATITAHVQNWIDAVTSITVNDDESNTVLIAFAPANATQFNEGSGDVPNAWLRLGGSVTTNVLVTLLSSDTSEASLPATVVVPAGTNSVPLALNIPDDAGFDGTKSVVLTAKANGFTSIPSSITVLDNDVHHLELSALPGLINANSVTEFMVRAKDVNGVTMSNMNFDLTISATNLTGNVPISPQVAQLTAGEWIGQVQFPSWEFSGVRVLVSGNGATAVSTSFDVRAPTILVATVPGYDVVFSPLSQRLYVNSANWLTPIDPYTGQVQGAYFMNALGPKIAASDDGQFIYLDRTGGNLGRFNVSSATLDQAWNSGAPGIEDLAAVPGWPTAVAVSRMAPNTSPRSRGVVIFNNGTQLPNSYSGGNMIEFGASSSRLYIFNNETTDFAFRRFTVDSTGLTYESSASLMYGFDTDFVCRGGRVFSSQGGVYDPERGIYIGSGPASPTIAGNAAEGRFYHWQLTGPNAGAIVASDLHTLVPIGTTPIGNVLSAMGNMVRWGSNGLAFRINSSSVAIVRSALIPAGAPADLVLKVPSPTPPPLVSNTFTVTYAISNAGPNVATNVVLTQTLPPNALFVSAAITNGACVLSGAGVACTVPSLASGATVTASISVAPQKPGPMTWKASVISSSSDPDLTNNRLSLHVPVRFTTRYDSSVELALQASDLVYDRASNRLCLSIPNANEVLGNSVITLDALTGLYDPPIPTAGDPGKLAISDDGTYLYAALNAQFSIQRLNLTTRTPETIFTTGFGTVFDMEVMPGHRDVVAATLPNTIAIYDRGIRRPNTVSPGPWGYGFNIEFGSASNRLYASFPLTFRRMNVDSNGVSVIEDVNRLIHDYTYDFDVAGGLAYALGGRIFNPETKTTVKNLGYPLVSVAVDGARMYTLQSRMGYFDLDIFDLPSYLALTGSPIFGVSGGPTNLLRWGADGLAFRTTSGQLFLFRTTAANDNDWDGLADAWETNYFGNINQPGGGPNDDPDQDGLTNLREFMVGLNPTVPDRIRFAGQPNLIGNGVQMRVSGPNGITYSLMATTNFIDWVPVMNFTVTNDPTTVIDWSNGNLPRRFYRISP